MLRVTVCNEELVLLPEKALLWPAQKMLVISDLHLGKSMHFRKAGIPLPLNSQQQDFVRLLKLLDMPGLQQVIFLGDLFHSDYNGDWEHLGIIMQQFPQLHFILVQGNHDILHENEYRRFGFSVADALKLGPFWFTHEPDDAPQGYNIFGHLHPGVRLSGQARQSLSLPCFLFSDVFGIMPSFGRLTGFKPINPKKTDKVFAIRPGAVIDISYR